MFVEAKKATHKKKHSIATGLDEQAFALRVAVLVLDQMVFEDGHELIFVGAGLAQGPSFGSVRIRAGPCGDRHP